jgi:hypothetical protein
MQFASAHSLADPGRLVEVAQQHRRGPVDREVGGRDRRIECSAGGDQTR